MVLIDHVEYEDETLVPESYNKTGIRIDRIDTLRNNNYSNLAVSKEVKGAPGRGRW